ncbi:MAG: arginine--tRNA ligase [Candidatus Bathyarchaeia archaeon]
MTNFLQEFRNECTQALDFALKKVYPSWSERIPRMAVPPTLEFGELSSSIAFDIAKESKLSPQETAKKIEKEIQVGESTYIASVEAVGGYANFRLNYAVAGNRILEAAAMEDAGYGIEKVDQPARISVEHTSVNPSGPITMGHARNSILGDTLARLLVGRGHKVNRRFYVDDVGRQVSILAYGYRLLEQPKPVGKVDHWFGRLYASTNCAVQIQTTRKKLKELGADSVDSEERLELQRNLDEWVAIAAELESTDKDILERVLKAVQEDPDPEKTIQQIGKKYEEGDKETVTLVHGVANPCLDGIKTSLSKIGITFDTWDWESQLLWDGRVEDAVKRLLKLPFARSEGTSYSLDINAIVDAYSLREQFGLSLTYEVPPLTLVRSDGTTLYATRDIAYTLVKFTDSDKVVNVIAREQSLPQLQIRLALYALGEHDAARNLVHYAYGLVEFPGMKMSKRRAHFISLDEVVDQAKARVGQTMARRKEELEKDEAENVIQSIALGAIKFAMLTVSSTKNLTFTWDRVLSLERNSGPSINYAYTRAGSILRKLGKVPEKADCSLLTHPLEHLLIFKVGQMPDAFQEAADQLKPEELANYSSSLAEKFHEYYEKVDVIHAEENVKNARAILVRAVQVALRNSLRLLGIEVSERM